MRLWQLYLALFPSPVLSCTTACNIGWEGYNLYMLHTHCVPFHRGIDLSGNTVGIAFTRSMCGVNSVSVTQDGGRTVSSTGSTAAHEIGHTFDMIHDAREWYTSFRTIASFELLATCVAGTVCCVATLGWPWCYSSFGGLIPQNLSMFMNPWTKDSVYITYIVFFTITKCLSTSILLSCTHLTQLIARVLIPPGAASWRQSQGSLPPRSGATAADLTSRMG